MDITLRMSDHALTARAAAAAGIVLLKNTAGTLPLLPAEDGVPLPVAVFGIRQLLTPAYDRAMTPWRAIGVLDGLMASDAVRPACSPANTAPGPWSTRTAASCR